MKKFIAAILLGFFLTFMAAGCGPMMPDENPKYKGTGIKSGGTPQDDTETDTTTPSETPAETPAEPETPTEDPQGEG